MHLDHKIPWNTAARNFDLKRCNPQRTPQVTDLFPRGLPNQSNDLNHFLRVFIATIREFSTTERSRYPKKLDTPIVESKSLFSDAVLSYPERKCGLGAHSTNSALHNPLSPEHQRIDSWIKRAQYYGLQSEKERRYTTSDGDLADAVKMLIIIAASAASEEDENEKKLAEDALSALLVLSHHCEVPLSSLNALTWGHGFGVQHVAMSALDIYLLINIVDAVKTSRRSADVNTALIMRKPKIGTEERSEVSLSEMNSFISRFCFQSLFNYDLFE